MPAQPAQARWWIGTLKYEHHECIGPATIRDGIVYIRGQRERGEGGFDHIQFVVACDRARRLAWVKRRIHSSVHVEPTRSAAAVEYVWKEDTRVAGSQFEYGHAPMQRNRKADWDAVWDAAKSGDMAAIPANIRVAHYRTLQQIRKDHLRPEGVERVVKVYWGTTGSGKSHKAWSEYPDAYPKDPLTKFWDGYQDHEAVIIDEFRGGINISHVLRWFDKYPVNVDVKFGACVFKAKTVIITSNIHPRDWYPELDEETKSALLRRLDITHFDIAFRQ